MANTTLLEETIRSLFAERFKGAQIDRVVVKHARDSDGDPIIWVTVVVEASQPLDRDMMVGFVRHLRSRIEDDEFPLVRFVSKADARNLNFEAA